jgi:hypothetical protein
MACPAKSNRVHANISSKLPRGWEHDDRCTFIRATNILDSSDMVRRMADPALISINIQAGDL